MNRRIKPFSITGARLGAGVKSFVDSLRSSVVVAAVTARPLRIQYPGAVYHVSSGVRQTLSTFFSAVLSTSYRKAFALRHVIPDLIANCAASFPKPLLKTADSCCNVFAGEHFLN